MTMLTDYLNQILIGDNRELSKRLPDASVNCIVTSPPYWGLRDYGTATWTGGEESHEHIGSEPRTVSGGAGKQYENKGSNRVYSGDCECGAKRVDNQIGLERTPEEYVLRLVELFRELRRVLRDDGTLWLNLGDSYAGGKGASGANPPEYIDKRKARGSKTLEKKHHCIGAKGYTKPGDDKALLKQSGIKPKDLVGIPWMVAFALRADGWYLRSDIIWHKPNPMPESVKDRPTKAHEYIFLLSKSDKYFYDHQAILEPANYDGRKDTMFKGADKYKNGFAPTGTSQQTMAKQGHERWSNKLKGTEYGGDGSGFKGHSGNYDADGNLLTYSKDGVPARNKRTVWTVPTKPFSGAHFATFPTELIEPCILAGCPVDGVVLDPFMGAGTVATVCKLLKRNYVGFELNPEYVNGIALDRVNGTPTPLFVTA